MCSSFLPWQGKLWLLAEGGGSIGGYRNFVQIFPPWCSYPNLHPDIQFQQNRIRVDSFPYPCPGYGKALAKDMFWLGLKDLSSPYISAYISSSSSKSNVSADHSYPSSTGTLFPKSPFPTPRMCFRS